LLSYTGLHKNPCHGDHRDDLKALLNDLRVFGGYHTALGNIYILITSTN